MFVYQKSLLELFSAAAYNDITKLKQHYAALLRSIKKVKIKKNDAQDFS